MASKAMQRFSFIFTFIGIFLFSMFLSYLFDGTGAIIGIILTGLAMLTAMVIGMDDIEGHHIAMKYNTFRSLYYLDQEAWYLFGKNAVKYIDSKNPKFDNTTVVVTFGPIDTIRVFKLFHRKHKEDSTLKDIEILDLLMKDAKDKIKKKENEAVSCQNKAIELLTQVLEN